MKKLYTALLTLIVTIAFFLALALVAYVEQQEVNKEHEKYANSWCNVDFGKSVATVECSRVSRLEIE